MFTGIIEEQGTCKRMRDTGHSMILTLQAKEVLKDVRGGDSIAVNGVCLTVTDYTKEEFTVDVMPETVKRTNIRDLQVGRAVNLERAMPANGRFGGHIVQGHVDGRGRISAKHQNENAIVFTIQPEDSHLFDFMLPQGSITLDGVSLTLVQVGKGDFQVSMIPHTLSVTSFQHKSVGDTVNIECDILGKYVKRLLEQQLKGEKKDLTFEYLKEQGFM